jgi:alanyl-tRNA synthetase
MKEKVIDMGAGLERFAWITQGSPTSYDVVFEHVLGRMNEQSTVDYDRDLLLRYSPYSGRMNLDDYPSISEARSAIASDIGVPESRLVERLSPIAALYAVADHSRTLLFAIADGQLPSNVGGGYNLRVVFRRAQSFIQRYGFKLDLVDVVNWHIDSLAAMYPELEEHRDDVSESRQTRPRRQSYRQVPGSICG